MRSELTQVLERLGATSGALERIVGSAGSDLDAIQGGLAERTAEFQRALGSISAQVAGLSRASAATQAEASALVERLGEHANSLTGAVQNLATTQESVDAAFEKRSGSLQALMGEIERKSQDFATLMQSFASTVEEFLQRAQARAKEINGALMMTTNGAAATVSSQFEMIRDNASKERERTAAALKEAYDQANAQLAGIMDQATERFKQSAAEVRTMAVEIQRELDGDEAGAAPRRARIAAGDERAGQRDAARHQRSDQGAERARRHRLQLERRLRYRRARRAAAPPPPPAAPQPPAPAQIEAPRPKESARRKRPRAPSRRPRSSNCPRRRPCCGRSRSSARRKRRARASCSRMPPTAAAPQRAQGGWLSDLLSRASRDEQPAPGAPPANPNPPAADALDAIAVSIANLIDPDAAAEMWDRWRRGDNGAFSRRLYTAQGQQTFDEIRRRCRADPQFRDTVERYTQEFERLLVKVGQNDRDGSQARAYLLSDTGKVYTMLAHASGRMG